LASGKVIKVPYAPFCGVMGVAPPPGVQLEAGKAPGVVSTGPPNVNGGNMDNRCVLTSSVFGL
jgi:acetamidase/formamidase